MLHLGGSADRLPKPGDPVHAGAAAVGFAGSSARHYELGPIALALIKRTVPVTEALQVAEISAAQEVIVPPDAGANVKIAIGRRSRDRKNTSELQSHSDIVCRLLLEKKKR